MCIHFVSTVYPKNIPKISRNYPRIYPWIYPICIHFVSNFYPKNIPKISRKYPRIYPMDISNGYIQYVSILYPIFIQILSMDTQIREIVYPWILSCVSMDNIWIRNGYFGYFLDIFHG